MKEQTGNFNYSLAANKFVGCSFFAVFILAIIIMIFANVDDGLIYAIVILSVLLIYVIYAVLQLINVKLEVTSKDLNITINGRFLKAKIDYPYRFEGKMIIVARRDEGVYFRLAITDSENRRFCFFERLPPNQIIEGVQTESLIRQKDSKMIINIKPYPDFVWNLYDKLKAKEQPKTESDNVEVDEKDFVFENPFVGEE